MLPKIKEHGLNLFSNIVSDILANKIVSLSWATGIAALATTRLYLEDQVWNPAIKLLKTPITTTQVPITALSLMLLIFLLGSFFYLGHKRRDWKESKVKYIDFNKLIWKVYKINNNYKFEPLCIKDCTALKLLLADYYRPGSYYYKCEWCGEEYSTDTADGERHALESRVDNFGIEHFKDRFVNIKQKIKPLKARSK